MAETYLWQNIANQGVTNMGKELFGYKEALEGAVNSHAGPTNVNFPVTDSKLITDIEA